MPELIGSFFVLEVITLFSLRRDARRSVELLQIRRDGCSLSYSFPTIYTSQTQFF